MDEQNYKRLGCVAEDCNGKHKAFGLCVTHYMRLKRSGTAEDLAAIPCAQCGATFQPSHRRAMYCTKRCKHSNWVARNAERHQLHRETAAQQPPKKTTIYAGYCQGCGGAFVARRKKEYCSEVCRPKPRTLSTVSKSQQCNCCGKEYKPVSTGGKPSASCSDECRNQHKEQSLKTYRKARKVKYGNTHRKRARASGVAYEPVNRIKVFDRDGWRCQICGKRTPPNRIGGHSANAPELDHRIPISKGGGHLYANVQCACRQCNNAKGNKTEAGQMPMFDA